MSVQAHSAFRRLFDQVGTVDQVGIEERVAKYTTRGIKKAAKVKGLKLAVSMVDLTTLEGKDTPGKVASLCQKALTPHEGLDVPQVAAVCVYSRHGQTRPARAGRGHGVCASPRWRPPFLPAKRPCAPGSPR